MRKVLGWCFLTVVFFLIGCSAADFYTGTFDSGSGIGFGGAGDWNYYKSQIESGYIPSSDELEVEGFFAAHSIYLPDPVSDPDNPISMHTHLALGLNIARGGLYTLLQLGFNTTLNLSNYSQVPLNICVVFDKSGSMSGSRIAYAKEGLRLLVDILGTNDILSIVTYNESAQVLWEAGYVTSPLTIKDEIDTIQADGSTGLHSGMVLGFEEVLKNYDPNKINRVLLLTDGLANQGITDTPTILNHASNYIAQGIGITTIGVGSGFNRELLLGLAELGNGNHYFLAGDSDAKYVFTNEIGYAITPIARNLNIQFNPASGLYIDRAFGFELQSQSNGASVLNIPTVYLSGRNGIMMVDLDYDSDLRGLNDIKLLDISYSYQMIDYTNSNFSRSDEVIFPGTNQSGGSPNVYYVANGGIRKSMALLNMAQTFQLVSDLVIESNDTEAALSKLRELQNYIRLENLLLEDTELTADYIIIGKFETNILNYMNR